MYVMKIVLGAALLGGLAILAAAGAAPPAGSQPAIKPAMLWADTVRLGRPFSKDPSVIRFHDRYLMYFSLPPAHGQGWIVGIAESTDLVQWKKVAELLPAQECDKKGLAAPGARVLNGKVHLFYQTYGNDKHDAICHAVSDDGVRFERDKSNPVFHPTGAWTNGRAIDAEVIPFNDKLLLYCATRDPSGKIQQLAVAQADLKSDFGRDAWKQACDASILKPELPWEGQCIEAPTVCRHGATLFMFYAGAYNNWPQQIGCASSPDGIHWQRLSEQPFLANGKAGEWNSSESGHPGVFVDDDGQTYLFYQGNNDNGRTWLLSWVKVGWKDDQPVLEAVAK